MIENHYLCKDNPLLTLVMTILEAIAARHSVRKYSDQALEPEKIGEG